MAQEAWHRETRCRERVMSKRIEVNLSRQVLLAFDGATQDFCFDCVSGDDSHPTPVGHWTIKRQASLLHQP